MRAIRFERHGSPEVLRLGDVETPCPSSDEVLVEVHAAGVNFMDVGMRRGLITSMSATPATPGVEGAGVVLVVGKGVTNVQPGDRVAWNFVPGSYAETVLAPATRLVRLPDDIDFETAAASMMQGITALYLTTRAYEVKAGDTALVHAAAGGVGRMLTQVITAAGGRVLGRVSREEKVAAAMAAGATDVIVSKADGFTEQVLRLTHGRGVEVVYDGTGAEGFDGSMRSLDYFGTLVTFGPLMEPPPPINPFALPKSIKLTAPSAMDAVRDPRRYAEYAAKLFEAIRTKRIGPEISGRFVLSDAAQAHQAIESRRTTGKLILLPKALP